MNFASVNFQRSEFSGLDVGGTKPFAESSALCCMPLKIKFKYMYRYMHFLLAWFGIPSTHFLFFEQIIGASQKLYTAHE